MKVSDAVSFSSFPSSPPSGILVQARKTVRLETRASLDELEEALEKARNKCAEDHGANVRAATKRGNAGRNGDERRKSGMNRRRVESTDEEEKEEMEVELKLEVRQVEYFFWGGGRGEGNKQFCFFFGEID